MGLLQPSLSSGLISDWLQWVWKRLPTAPKKNLIRLSPLEKLGYAEKVRSQFLSLRHSYGPCDFSINEQAENLPIKWDFSRAATVLEIAEMRHFRLGDGIFLQGFVL